MFCWSLPVSPPLQLLDGDGLLLCTDGLHGSVGDNMIPATIAAAASPQQAAKNLVELALTNGSTDNITVLYACSKRLQPISL